MRNQIAWITHGVLNQAERAAEKNKCADGVQNPKHLPPVAREIFNGSVVHFALHANLEINGRDEEDDENEELESETGNDDFLACDREIEFHGAHDTGACGVLA